MTTNKIGNYRWRILVLIFFATTINYIDRQVIGMLKPYIAQDLGWTEAGYGYIVTAFQAAYAMGLLLAGRLLDKFGTKAGYSFAIIIWSIAGMAHAAARSVFSFGMARFFLGLGESANFPAAIKSVAEWFPKKERALATGLFNSGSSIGAITAPIIVTSITLSYGWQWAFIITGAFGFIWIIFWLLFYKIPSSHAKLSSEEYRYIHSDQDEVNEKPMRWKDIIGYRQTVAICLSRFVTDWVWWFFLFWGPAFLNKSFGINLKESVLPLIIIYSVSGLGGISMGWLSSHLIKSGKSIDYSRKTAILVCAIIVLPILAAPQINNLWIVTGLISLAAAAHMGWASNIFTVVSDIFPKKAVATVTGLSGFAGAVGGTIASPVVGLVLESTNSYFLILSVAGFSYLTAWLILKIMIRKIEPVSIKILTTTE
jgi:ACS family hexuronate transporter-like MFS transporter